MFSGRGEDDVINVVHHVVTEKKLSVTVSLRLRAAPSLPCVCRILFGALLSSDMTRSWRYARRWLNWGVSGAPFVLAALSYRGRVDAWVRFGCLWPWGECKMVVLRPKEDIVRRSCRVQRLK